MSIALPTISLDQVLARGPCPDWPESRIRELAATRESWTALDVLRCRRIPHEDRLWLVLHTGVIPDHEQRLFTVICAERALRRERRAGREPDPQSWEVCRVVRRWLDGSATNEELRAATAEAATATAATATNEELRAATAAWAAWAAWAAEATAAWAAAAEAAEAAAALAAARDAERRWQVRRLIRLLETGE